MKKITSFLLTFFAFLSVYANDAITTIQGHVDRENAKSIILYHVIEGKKVEYANTKLDVNNNFAFAIPSVKEGFYYLSDQRKRDYIRIYLTPGEKLEIEMNESGYVLNKGSKENKLLYDWFTLASPVTGPSFNWMEDTSTYKSFFPKVEILSTKLASFKEKINTKNKRFNSLMNMLVDVETEYAALYFLIVPNTIHPKKEQYPAFYSQIIQPAKYKSTDLLDLGEGVEILSRYTTFYGLMNPSKERQTNFLQLNAELLGNDTLKGAYVANSIRFKSYEEVEKGVEPVKKYLFTDSMKAAYFRALKGVADLKKGSPSFNFAYEDLSGKKVSMTDLKGKVVLVDVWATWCGPCKVEIPHLKQLEEEFKGKNVEFVSISVDVEKDKEKWKNMIAKDQLGGTQLFASGWSDITKYYDITGIPRFLVFDQEGKIVTINAPRPSKPELKTLLENTLEGK